MLVLCNRQGRAEAAWALHSQKGAAFRAEKERGLEEEVEDLEQESPHSSTAVLFPLINKTWRDTRLPIHWCWSQSKVLGAGAVLPSLP